MLPLLASHEARAREVLPPEVHDWMSNGSSPEHEAAWSRRRLRPHVLRDVSSVDTTTTILGTSTAAPVVVGPTAFHSMAHAEGESATHRGATAAGALMVWAMRSDVPVQGACWWQAYVLQERALTRDAALRARDGGATAIVLTGDTPFLGNDRRGPLGALDQAADVTLADIGWLHELTGLPVLVKGVLRADDAQDCVQAGAAGVIVSNHGGRQLSRTVATADALPEIADAVGDLVPVLVDGGIRSGVDVLVALALGAKAVLLGKPVLWALASDGASGVEVCLRAVADDLRFAMGLAGCPTLSDIDRSLIA
jgi:4-hydroxymandelate oxidase